MTRLSLSTGAEVLRRAQAAGVRLQLIAEALPELTDAHRRSILSDLAGEDYRSIAAREGITVGSARVRFHRATQKLQQVIKSRRATPATPA